MPSKWKQLRKTFPHYHESVPEVWLFKWNLSPPNLDISRAYKQQFTVFIFLNFTIFWLWHFWGWNAWSKHSKEKKTLLWRKHTQFFGRFISFQDFIFRFWKKEIIMLLCFSEQALSAVSMTDISALTVSQKKIKPMQENWGIPALARAFFIFFLVCSLEA